MMILECIWDCLPDWIKEILISLLLTIIMYFGGPAYLEYLPQYFDDLCNFFPGQETSDIIVNSLIVIIGPIAFYFAFKYVMDNVYQFIVWILKLVSVY